MFVSSELLLTYHQHIDLVCLHTSLTLPTPTQLLDRPLMSDYVSRSLFPFSAWGARNETIVIVQIEW